jgi:hypothetical protein
MKKGIIALCFCFLTITIIAQDQKHEVSSEVKELSAFHTVIYKIWHTAWPKKDVVMLQTLLPEVEKGAQSIASAKLPGILRDKQSKWEIGINDLKNCVDSYKAASDKKDSSALLSAAEKLHSQYEGLVRVIRPLLKEVDQFHQELYLVYHYYMPEKKADKIQASAKVLAERMNDLKKAQLPERLKSKKANFDKAVLELNTSVEKLTETITKTDVAKKIDDAILLVRTKYQDLEKVFD